jgi:hypothetical protein
MPSNLSNFPFFSVFNVFQLTSGNYLRVLSSFICANKCVGIHSLKKIKTGAFFIKNAITFYLKKTLQTWFFFKSMYVVLCFLWYAKK